MRQGQQNRRGRSRGRKQQNPLARNYESNGPDVRIRGTASHIADKYGSLARDALSAGDIVAAENLFQHAEHYNRIIMAAQAQQNPQTPQPVQVEAPNGSGPQPHSSNGVDASESAQQQANTEQPESAQHAASPDSEQGRRKVKRKSSGNGNARSKTRPDSKARRAEQTENGEDLHSSGHGNPDRRTDGGAKAKVEKETEAEPSKSDADNNDRTSDGPVV